MSLPDTNRSMFDQSSENILKRGLHTMSLACEALSDQNENLNKQVEELNTVVKQLNEKLLAQQS